MTLVSRLTGILFADLAQPMAQLLATPVKVVL
jgi:hypothetical protein